MTQNEKVLAYMREKGGITSYGAFTIGCLRLSARIHELRRMGHKIEAETVYGKNRDNEPVHFTRYRLEK